MPRSHKFVGYWEHEGEEMEVEVSVGPASRDAHEYGRCEVEVIEVRDGKGPRPDLLDKVPEKVINKILDDAVEEAARADEAAYEDEMERRFESERDGDY